MPRSRRGLQTHNFHGYTTDRYPTSRSLLVPEHGRSPRCSVDINVGDDSPVTQLRILTIEDGNEEEHRCNMPRCYAIPLILINKRLAFYEAQCHPNGVPLHLANGSPTIRTKERMDYTYLWHLRPRELLLFGRFKLEVRLRAWIPPSDLQVVRP
ncbi:hypothetical protein BGW80DRAFT_1259884 [Lactifluus volemus]|nr:hypothetical protein BGW80DRAFT_1259884 [Lactifluus volemus]